MKKTLGLAVFVAATAASSAMAAATFYETPQFGGRPLSVDGVIPDFRDYDYNDRAMSLVVDGSPLVVCEHINFGGNCQVFNPGAYPHLGAWSHQISSVRPADYRAQYIDRRHEQHYYDRRVHNRHDHDGQSSWSRRHWDYAPNGYYRRDY